MFRAPTIVRLEADGIRVDKKGTSTAPSRRRVDYLPKETLANQSSETVSNWPGRQRWQTLYITASTSVYRIKLKVRE